MKKIPMLATKEIVLSFFLLIVLGSILLSLPIANKVDPQPYINNLFVATSCVCVTGLTPFTIVDQYNLFGQIVMMILIQFGGLGLITFLYLTFFIFRRKVSLNSKIVFKEALNQDDLSKLPRLLKTIFYYTGIFELVGMVLLAIVFVPEYGLQTGVYYGLWHSISAFCNAGFDLLGNHSLMDYATKPFINIVMMVLIVAGGLGFIVALDIHDKRKKQKHFSMNRLFQHLALHSKIVILMTIALIVSGTVLFFLFEFENPDTIGELPIGDRILVSLFQSVTLRTAGFATVSIQACRNVTKLVMCIFMFVGGSPASTAGGIKTVTFALVLLNVLNIFHGNEETFAYNRRIKKRVLLRAQALFVIGITICLIGVIALSLSDVEIPFIDSLVEIFSAFGTVGLSADVTGRLTGVGKVIDIILMFVGRISPMSLTIFFAKRAYHSHAINYTDEDVIIG